MTLYKIEATFQGFSLLLVNISNMISLSIESCNNFENRTCIILYNVQNSEKNKNQKFWCASHDD